MQPVNEGIERSEFSDEIELKQPVKLTGKMTDRFSEMPDDMILDIIRRVDAPEVGGMAGMNHYWREVLYDPDFTSSYNRLRLSPSFVHALLDKSSIAGCLIGFRDYDHRRITVSLDNIFEKNTDKSVVTKGDALCASRSLFLFSRIRDDTAVALVVVNITNGNTKVVHCPDPMKATSFVDHRNNIKLVVDEADLEFKIIHVLSVVDDQSVVYCEYDSRNGGMWTHIGKARLLYPAERLDTSDYRRMLMLDTDPIPLISFDKDRPVFMAVNGHDLTRNAMRKFHITRRDLNPLEQWVATPGLYHSRGNDGWNVHTIWYKYNAYSRLWKMFLLRLIPADWSEFELIETVVDDRMRDPFFELVGKLQVEETNGVVHIAALTHTENQDWSMLFFKYDIAHKSWSFKQLKPHDLCR